jgi:hypothetical protein
MTGYDIMLHDQEAPIQTPIFFSKIEIVGVYVC